MKIHYVLSNGSYLYDEEKEVIKVKKPSKCCSSVENPEEGSIEAKSYVSRNWSLKQIDDSNCKCKESNDKTSDWDKIIDSIYKKSFSISAMAFQDVWNVDIERVKECCIHVVAPDGRLIPFCLYNISDKDGRYLYRK